MNQVLLATYQSQLSLSQVAQDKFVACIHVYNLSFYPMTWLGFKAKFLILPKHHLRTREGEPHPQIEGSGPLARVWTAPIQSRSGKCRTAMPIYLAGDFPSQCKETFIKKMELESSQMLWGILKTRQISKEGNKKGIEEWLKYQTGKQ